jgi:hypothetical protein
MGCLALGHKHVKYLHAAGTFRLLEQTLHTDAQRKETYTLMPTPSLLQAAQLMTHQMPPSCTTYHTCNWQPMRKHNPINAMTVQQNPIHLRAQKLISLHTLNTIVLPPETMRLHLHLRQSGR